MESQLDTPAASFPARDNKALPAEVVLSDVHVGRCSPGCTWWTSSFSRIIETGASSSGRGRDADRGGLGSASEGHQADVRGFVDEDGDLVLPRKKIKKLIPQRQPPPDVVIRHHGATPISGVGLQVWRGSLLLADFAMSSALGRRVRGKTCLELGSGTGVAGILLARSGADVFITDIGDDVLRNCADNVGANEELVGGGGAVWVRELDWGSPHHATGASSADGGDGAAAPAAAAAAAASQGHPQKGSSPFGWSVPDRQRLQELEYVFAGDTVYDDSLTDSFLVCARHLLLLPRRPVLFLAMEKRWNFTLQDMDTRAPAFDHLMRLLGVAASSSSLSREGAAASADAASDDDGDDGDGDDDDADGNDDDDDDDGDGVIWHARVCLGSLDPSSPLHVAGAAEVLEIGRMDVARIPQRLEYERGPDLEMWRLRVLSSMAGDGSNCTRAT